MLKRFASLPRPLLLAGVVGTIAPFLAAASLPAADPLGVPLPPGINPILAWVLMGLCSVGSLPATWLAWRLAKLGAGVSVAGVRALAAFIRHHTQKTPTKLDDGPGESIAKILEHQADDMEADAKRAGPKAE